MQILKERLGAKRVLIVLDDVTDLDQLNALCGSGEWCRPGSVVIITTRHGDLLRVCKLTFNLEEMNEAESLELFSWHAFKQACPKEEFVKLSTDVVEYSNGLPLALEVLGSHLFNMGIKEWESALDTLKSIPHDKIPLMGAEFWDLEIGDYLEMFDTVFSRPCNCSGSEGEPSSSAAQATIQGHTVLEAL
ncbi:hypothetical protein HN51_047971 [Arachis hypogaea]